MENGVKQAIERARYITDIPSQKRSWAAGIQKVMQFTDAKPYAWQVAASMLVGARRDNGKMRFKTGYISVPRQSGKTKISYGIDLHRLLVQPNARVWHTAQTGQAARDRWVEELANPAQRHLPSMIKLKKGAGDTRLIIIANGSQSRPMPPNDAYLHGSQTDLTFIDEAWAHDEAAGAALLQAILPASANRQDHQLILLSTAGDERSSWWHDGMEKAKNDPEAFIIDYGIADDDDPTDLARVIACHPRGDEEHVQEVLRRDQKIMSPEEFARAYGNRRTSNGEYTTLKNVEYSQLMTDKPLDAGEVIITAAVSYDKSESAICAWGTIEGKPAVEVISSRPGISWAAKRLVSIWENHGHPRVILDSAGPAVLLKRQIESIVGEKIPIEEISIRELAFSTESFIDSVSGLKPKILIRRNMKLRREMEFFRVRDFSDMGRVLSRKLSPIPVATLEAALIGMIAVGKPRQAAGPIQIVSI